MNATAIPDATIRRTALDPTRSFIVQAPAGSGKTTLLIQRYLGLLARVDEPEEVVAITFTRKAAREMLERVTNALGMARDEATDITPPELDPLTLDLARAVIARQADRGWHLLEQPSRLRILTIDALSAAIARQMPWLSRFGGDAAISEDAGPLYRKAAIETLALLDTEEGWSQAVATVLEHLDNDLERFESLIEAMLARRDQWLRHLAPRADPTVLATEWRAELERALRAMVTDELERLCEAVPVGLAPELVAVCSFAGSNLANAATGESAATACAELGALPGAMPDALAPWRGVAEVMLTSGGTWRRRLTKANGFPAGKSPIDADWKARAESLIEALQAHDDLRRRLHAVRSLPEPRYTDAQWHVLAALLEALYVASGNLRVVFAEQGLVDFIEVVHAAGQALGDADAPTDLALSLDYRIRHLLVDEFQDTSHAHGELLAQLLAGWSPGDGHTLFLVGDPMQSIYRFREADVGLFLRVREEGLGGLPLESLQLSANFRSDANVVDWVNRCFPAVLAGEDEPTSGAVRYVPSRAVLEERADSGVRVHVCRGDERGASFVDIVSDALGRDTHSSVAVLVRSRGHLRPLLPELHRAGLDYRGVELDPLAALPEVQDMLALTRALLHPADRVAWLAVLRAPWCGLGLAELLSIAGHEPEPDPRTLLERLVDPHVHEQLHHTERDRVVRVAEVLNDAVQGRGRRTLRRRVEGAWIALGGPACVDGPALDNANAYLDMLESLERRGVGDDPDELELAAGDLFAAPAHPQARLEIMTIHKAKGLEFDIVIVPGLERTPRNDSRQVLAWSQRASGADVAGANLLLAPIPSKDGDEPAIYAYLNDLEASRAGYELGRLAYVAATRARRELHWLATIDEQRDPDKPLSPRKGALLECLWPAIGNEVRERAESFERLDTRFADATVTMEQGRQRRRLPGDWGAPAFDADVRWETTSPDSRDRNAPDSVEFAWAGRTARHVGTVVHRALRLIAEEGPGPWDTERLDGRMPYWRATLRRLGVPRDELEPAVIHVRDAVQATLADSKGRWLVDHTHHEAYAELPISGVVDGALVHGIIDRTFVDHEGVRWVVDYKSGRHEGADAEAFLDRERERYRAQLERYARLLGERDDRPIRLGLYFPMLAGWREWSFTRAR